MEISLYHRLAGIWLGAVHGASRDESVRRCWQMAQGLSKGLLAVERLEVTGLEWDDQPLANGLVLLPVLIFFHEDPLYLGDRLHDDQFCLPAEQMPVILELGNVLSCILRERLTLAGFSQYLIEHSLVGELFVALANPRTTWRQWQKNVAGLEVEAVSKQLLLIYGAIAYGQGLGLGQSLRLVENCEPIVQTWVAVILGAWGGDRHFSIELMRQYDLRIIHREVQQFWSTWSGLPHGNQLHLDRFPVIASSQVIQHRSSLKLISQRHLV